MFDNLKSWVLSLGSSQMVTKVIIPAALTLVIGIVVIKAVMKLLDKAMEKSHLEKAAYSLIKSVVRVTLYVLLGLVVASALKIDVTGVIALASVLTLAVSLALQNALTNLIGGFTLLYTRPFSSGDFVDIAGKSGKVQEIGMTYTMLITPDNKAISIPNSSVVAQDIVNYTTTGVRRMDVSVYVAGDEPVQKVLDALIQAGTVDNVLMEPAPFATINAYRENNIEYALRVWTKTEDYWDVNHIVTQNIKNIFDAQGIKVSYPHTHVLTK